MTDKKFTTYQEAWNLTLKPRAEAAKEGWADKWDEADTFVRTLDCDLGLPVDQASVDYLVKCLRREKCRDVYLND